MKNFERQILALAIVVALVLSLGAFAFAAEFTDMPSESHWAYKALNASIENGLLKGDTSGKLNPKANLKRAEMAAIINRAFGAVQAADISKYTDVSKSAWYYTDIAKAVVMGTFQGDSSIAMRPESSITRQEAFVVLARAIRLSEGNTAVLDKFSDKALVASWAKSEIAAMVAAGYINGSDGKLNPTSTITRQEFAQLMYNAISGYISKAGTVTTVSKGNIMVNVSGVTLKNLTVKGDLIVGDGVSNGDFTLDNVKVEGRLVVRGGGNNSIVIKNKSVVNSLVVYKTSDGELRFKSDVSIEYGYVDDGKDGIIFEAEIKNLVISTTTAIEVTGKVGKLTIKKEALGVSISGTGKITEAFVYGDYASIDVDGTKVVIDKSAKGTTIFGTRYDGGSTIAAVKPSTGGGGGSGSHLTYEPQIDSMIIDLTANLNKALATRAELGELSSTNIIECKYNDGTMTVTNVAMLTVKELTDIINSSLSQACVKSITIDNSTIEVTGGLTFQSVKDFVKGVIILGNKTLSELETDGGITAIVTDKLGNEITYKLVFKLKSAV